MKYRFFLMFILSMCFSIPSHSQTIIDMELYNGVYRIPCSVNGAKMKFIFDTGAHTVCISMSMAEYLLDNGYLKKEDIKGTGTSVIADGSIINNVSINIRDLEIQGNHLYNVDAVVVEGQNAPLLMGQSAIQKLGAIELNGNRLIIKNGQTSYLEDRKWLYETLTNDGYNDGENFEEFNSLLNTNEESRQWVYKTGIAEGYDLGDSYEEFEALIGYNVNSQSPISLLLEQAHKAYEDHLYNIAESKYGQLYALDALSSYGLYMYARSCYFNNNEELAENILHTISDYLYFEKEEIDIYGFIGDVKFSLRKFSEAVKYYDLSNQKLQKTLSEWSINFRLMGDCYYFDGLYSMAAENYRIAAQAYAQNYNVDLPYLQKDSKNQLKKNQISYRSDDIDYILFQLFDCNEKSGAWDTKSFLFEITAMARAGNKYAQKTLNSTGINPYSAAWR